MDPKTVSIFDGLQIQNNGENNEIVIDDSCNFARSKITITGNNNRVVLQPTLSYNQLQINLKGNNKHVSIDASNKYINNLKLVSIRGDNQRIEIGKNLSCGGMEVQMNDGDETLSIGDNCLFSWGIKARTSDGHSIIDLDTNKPLNFPENIVISDRVWICEDVYIMKGVTIPSDSIIGAASLLTKKFEETNTVIAGVPAKVVRTNVKWDYRQPSKYKG